MADPTDTPRRIPSLTADLRSGAAYCVLVFLIARVGLSVLAVLTVDDVPRLDPAGFPTTTSFRPVTPGWHNAWDGTYRWDAGWYVQIASSGYDPDDGSAEFYPGFPLLARAVDAIVPGGSVDAALLMANLCFLAALIVLHALTRLEFDERVARRTVVLVTCFPVAFVFMSPYSEALFLLATVGAFYLARSERWAGAAIAGVVATATRAAGFLIIPALLLEAFRSPADGRRGRRYVAALVPAVGVGAYLAYWQLRIGNGLLPVQSPARWGRTLQNPIEMFARGIADGARGIGDADGVMWTADAALTLAVIVTLALGWRHIRTSYLVYAATSLIAVMTVAYPPRPLVGAPRYAAVMFPAFWIVADRFGTRTYIATVIVCCVAYVVLATTFMGQARLVF